MLKDRPVDCLLMQLGDFFRLVRIWSRETSSVNDLTAPPDWSWIMISNFDILVKKVPILQIVVFPAQIPCSVRYPFTWTRYRTGKFLEFCYPIVDSIMGIILSIPSVWWQDVTYRWYNDNLLLRLKIRKINFLDILFLL